MIDSNRLIWALVMDETTHGYAAIDSSRSNNGLLD
jgi:hypothetical protein